MEAIKLQQLTFETEVRPVVVPVWKYFTDTHVIKYRTPDGRLFDTEEEAELEVLKQIQLQEIKNWLQYIEEPELKEYKQCHSSNEVIECYSILVPRGKEQEGWYKLCVLESAMTRYIWAKASAWFLDHCSQKRLLVTVEQDHSYSGLTPNGDIDFNVEVRSEVHAWYLKSLQYGK